ncbi:MAG: hypothetical protein A4E57_02799 [Syntrophorhabdaceae bacterium PtaU1.Bin034]|nr:MAG: hypothetical protein A4E57_02799 [Syntrophorhabdaceae bacterium PtaU1.Bin034]
MLGKHTLAPHEKTSLTIIFNTAGLPGPFRKTATMGTKNPDQGELEVTIQGTVKEAPCAKIKATPRRIDLGGVSEGTAVRRKLTIANTGTLPLIITRIFMKSTGAAVHAASAQKPMTIAAGSEQTIECVITADRPKGQYQDAIMFESNAKNAPKGGYVIMVRNDGG